VCSTGSTAGILFYGDTITYPDNTIEEVEYEILPYPVLKEEKKLPFKEEENGDYKIGRKERICGIFVYKVVYLLREKYRICFTDRLSSGNKKSL
jgi:hypothetical protein